MNGWVGGWIYKSFIFTTYILLDMYIYILEYFGLVYYYF